MKEKRLYLILLISSITIVLMAVAAESLYLSDFEYRIHTKRVNRIINEKEKVLDNCMTGLRLIFARGGSPQSVAESAIFSIAEKNQIALLYYIDGKLIYWSDNGFDVPIMLDNSLFSKPIVFIRNGWFVPGTIGAGNERIIGLLRVRTDYGFENDVVKSGFEKVYKLPEHTGLGTDRSVSGYNVFNSNGDFLFSLNFPEEKSNTYLILFPLLLWLASFILLIILLLRAAKVFFDRGKGFPGIAIIFSGFVLMYFFQLTTGKPEIIFRTDLFSPYIVSFGKLIPSLGHLLIFSTLTAIFTFVFYSRCPINQMHKEAPVKEFLVFTLMFVLSALLISICHIIFSNLISDSNINFETYKVLKISYLTVAGFVSIILLMTAPVFIILKTYIAFRDRGKSLIIIATVVSLIVITAFLNRDLWSLLVLALLFTGIILVVAFSIRRNIAAFNISVIFSLLFGLYSLYVVMVFSEKKINDNIKVQAFSFSTDHDPEAEHLLIELWPEITKDVVLDTMMDVEYFERKNYDAILGYLRENYFNGYWGNFSFNIFLCRSDESISLGAGEGINENNCFSFFDERIRRFGKQLTGTGFYFIDDQGGRSNYLGRLFYSRPGSYTNGLFIELYSDINVFQPGYSELLLDKKFRGYAGLKDYSFAKYINGEIVLQGGDFAYFKSDEDYIDNVSDYRFFRDGGYIHTLYRNGNATIIISRPAIKAGNLIISFAYIFIFIFIFTNLVMMLIKPPVMKGVVSLSFSQKLQASFAGVLLASYIVTGIVVAYLIIRQYKSEHNDNIREKLGSIYLELENKISPEKYLSAEWKNNTYESLNELLIDLSNVFNTDINMYDLTGFLMATSRPEIFYRDLAARRMNILAFMHLKDRGESEYIQNEKLGNMSYLSAYVPFYNSEKKVLGYVNLPYFRMQSLLTRDITNLIVAVINFTLLLILLTMGFAVFISNRLTSPFSMLSEGIASVKLGQKSKHLSYAGSDEIGELVKQYNIMVDELEESAHKLANSEREYAWREMAKQIAHEIKNPLTPMKLNIQQLLKSWKDGIPGFDEKIESFSRNQIEYIDNLSSIATAFSSFAKMPGTNPGIIDLPEHIKTTLELFRNTDNVTFSEKWPHESRVFIYADKEQLNGIFSNLFKNSIQAIPQGRAGLIKVTMETRGDKVIVSVSDNGTGIPESLQKKLFTPNFTTKSSGTGLGLSIAKKYVEGANGRIWFESEADKGTTFYIEFPLLYTVEKPGEASSR